MPRKTLLLWRIRAFIIGIILILICFCLDFKLNFLAIAIITVFFGAVILWILPLFFNSYKIWVLEGSVIVKRGIFFSTTYIFPYNRFIYAKRLQSPLSKAFSLVAISLKAASSGVLIAELSKSDASDLLTQITRERSKFEKDI